jgi:hypothetical protein
MGVRDYAQQTGYVFMWNLRQIHRICHQIDKLSKELDSTAVELRTLDARPPTDQVKALMTLLIKQRQGIFEKILGFNRDLRGILFGITQNIQNFDTQGWRQLLSDEQIRVRKLVQQGKITPPEAITVKMSTMRNVNVPINRLGGIRDTLFEPARETVTFHGGVPNAMIYSHGEEKKETKEQLVVRTVQRTSYMTSVPRIPIAHATPSTEQKRKTVNQESGPSTPTTEVATTLAELSEQPTHVGSLRPSSLQGRITASEQRKRKRVRTRTPSNTTKQKRTKK